MKNFILQAIERGSLPLSIERFLTRMLIRQRVRSLHQGDLESRQKDRIEFIENIAQSPVALVPDKANKQHYEVPAQFFNLVLGKHRKYSSCLWEPGCATLDKAEADMLELSCRRAELEDGMKILELGCGWGSLSLWMAEHFPSSQITSVSNSHSQRRFIEAEADRRGIRNLIVITCDMNDFNIASGFDRVVSIEMFEHMRNWPALLARINEWLTPTGKLFVHIFCHKDTPYIFQEEGTHNWMGRYFFSGGMMPAADTLLYFQRHFTVQKHWYVCGTHYQKTAQAWRQLLEARRSEALKILSETYGSENEKLWFQRWRLFFLACEELFGFRGGSEWFVCHYLYQVRK